MKQIRFRLVLFVIPLAIFWVLSAGSVADVFAQESATTLTPPVSSTGIYITVLYDEPFANIRLGPSSIIYPKVGRLYPGDIAPALGRSPGGEWIRIEITSIPNDEFVAAPNNKGWIYSALVQVSGGPLQIVEPPPTPVPPPTSTIDPTLAAQFTIFPTNTRLPTYTPPPSLVVPSFTQAVPAVKSDAIPMAMVIISWGSLGVFLFILSFFFRRR